MTTDTQAEIEKLKQLNAFKSDVISISAHELRTSLSALKWILKMFLDNDVGTLSPEQENLMKKAYTSNERMIGLVTEMLSINHTEEVSLSYDFEPLEITDVIDNVLFDFVGESYKKGVEVIFLKPEEKLPHIKGDAAKLRVVLQGLIENGIKYSNSGDKIFISTRVQENMMEISIKDTGIGITKEDQPLIFQKFFRAKNAQAVETIGTGFGLYTAKQVIEKHGGKIWFKSAEGEGATFYFTVPLAKE